MTTGKVITIDGPAGAGKSTVSILLATKLCYLYLDSGAIYRVFAYKVKKEGVDTNDDVRLVEIGKKINIRIIQSNGLYAVFLDDEDVTNKIRDPEISMLASKVSVHPGVRSALLALQREAGAQGGIVAEGRDMGTVVFPNADYKFFLDATPTERARRRCHELSTKNYAVNYKSVLEDIMMRDKQDSERATAPLKPAADAIIIDSTEMKIDEVLNKITKIIN